MKKTHPHIILNCVPGGCTPVFQACNIGFQQIFKHLLKRLYHENVVAEVFKKLEGGEDIQFNCQISLMCDQSVRWLLDAFVMLSQPVLIQKVVHK